MLRTPPTPLLLALALAACGGSDGGGSAPGLGSPLTTYVGFERSNGIASMARGDRAFESGFSLINEAEGGIALDYFGNAYQADIRPDGGAVQVLWRVRDRRYVDDTGVFTATLDREIAGFTTTLMEPRDVALAHGGGWLFVTDTGDGAIKVWGSAAGGDVAPLFTTTPAAAPWDVAYDEASDRLFAALGDGTIAVFDDYVAARPAAPARTIVPVGAGMAAASTSLRGIVHVTAGGRDQILVADLGPLGGPAVDGAILRVDDASLADGPTPVSGAIRGAQSRLADPTDLALDPEGGLRVADAGAGRAFYFAPGFTGGASAFGTRAPVVSKPISLPRGVAIEPLQPVETIPSVSDIDDPATPLAGLLVTVAPAGMNGELQRVPADLSGPATAMFDAGRPLSAVTVDALGDVYAGTTDGVNGGLVVVNRLATGRGTGLDVTFDAARDRLLTIEPSPFFPTTTPVDPAGMDIDEGQGVVVIADPGLPGLWLFGRTAGPRSVEALLIQDGFSSGGGRPLGVDYDATRDRLYVAVSSGAVYVYDSFLQVPGTLPDRIITPSDAIGSVQVSTSLSAVVHDAQRDVLILTEVGSSTGTSNDGAIYVIHGASTASGLTPPDATLTGAATMLDEPTAIAWNGAALWVAESQNGQLLRFDDLLTLGGDVAPTASLALPDVRGVALNPTGLAPTAGGSIDVD